MAPRHLSRTLSALLGIACAAAATPAAAQAVNVPLPAALPHRAKIAGGLPLFFVPRPAADGSRRILGGATEAPALIQLASPPTRADLRALRALGVDVEQRRDGSPRGVGATIAATVPVHALGAVAALPRVKKLRLDGSPFPAPRPLDGTAAEVQATDAWRARSAEGGPYTGAGITVCDIDSGIDPFHPLFFRADGGYVSWVDVNGDGVLSPGVDGIDAGDGQVTVLRVLNSLVTNFWSDEPLFGSDDTSFALGMDWLYADTNGSGEREVGPKAGFTEADPTYGERLFVADDVNGNGVLEVGEKIVALGTSKIRALRVNKKKFRRGENLIDAPQDPDAGHGSGAAGVMVGGNIGLTRLVGIAPDADLVMASNTDGTGELALADFCMDEGARVVLHEYAPWVGHHLDGSSAMEALIDASVAKGVVHVNPAGNLSTSKKLLKRTIPAGDVTTIAIEAPKNSPYGAFTYMGLSLLWRDPSRNLALELEDPTGFKMAVTKPDPLETIYTSWHDGVAVYAAREDSSRGTARVDVYVFGEGAKPAAIERGGWKLHVTEPSAQGSPDLEVFGYVIDELSGWGLGIHFPEFSSEDHLIGYPGTADKGIAVAAYTGHGWNGDPPGERAYYSGRGRRIDGESILWISAPDDPITSGYRKGSPAVDFIYGGTSGASPHVAGAAALLLQADPARTGDDVRQAIKAGALVDDAVGSAPNEDYGHGKLRIYRSLFGEDPPGGSSPSVKVDRVKVTLGAEAVAPINVFDADEAAEGLLVEIDRDYEGVFEETLKEPVIRGKFDALGTYVAKVRVTDSTGRHGYALSVVDVAAPLPEEEAPTEPALVAGGGSACAQRGGDLGAWSASAGLLGGIAALGLSRRRRGRRSRPPRC